MLNAYKTEQDHKALSLYRVGLGNTTGISDDKMGNHNQREYQIPYGIYSNTILLNVKKYDLIAVIALLYFSYFNQSNQYNYLRKKSYSIIKIF